MENNFIYCVVIFQLFGIFQINFSRKSGFSKYLVKFLNVYSIILLCLFSLSRLLGTKESSILKQTWKTFIFNLFKFTLRCSSFLLASAYVIESIVMQKSMQKFFQNISKFNLLAKKNFTLRLSYTKFFIFHLISFIFCIILSFFAYTFSNHSKKNIFDISQAIFSTLFWMVGRYKFIFFVQLINFHLEYLLKFLNEILKNEKKNILKITIRQRMFRLQKSFAKKIKIRNFLKMYNLIKECNYLLNQSMRFALILDYIMKIVSCVLSIYELYLLKFQEGADIFQNCKLINSQDLLIISHSI